MLEFFELETINSLLQTGSLAGLFIFTVISSSLIPFGLPEVVVIGMWVIGFEPISVMVVATVGGVIGSVINYYMGRAGNEYILHKFIKPTKLKKAETLFNKYGPIVLLLAWVPFVGDPLTAVAGLLKYPAKFFLFYVTLGKFFRFVLLYLIFVGI
jgi:membrane protein YqaA with SNARE-associated domain